MFISVRKHVTCYARRISMEGSKLENTFTDLLAMVVFAELILFIFSFWFLRYSHDLLCALMTL